MVPGGCWNKCFTSNTLNIQWWATFPARTRNAPWKHCSFPSDWIPGLVNHQIPGGTKYGRPHVFASTWHDQSRLPRTTYDLSRSWPFVFLCKKKNGNNMNIPSRERNITKFSLESTGQVDTKGKLMFHPKTLFKKPTSSINHEKMCEVDGWGPSLSAQIGDHYSQNCWEIYSNAPIFDIGKKHETMFSWCFSLESDFSKHRGLSQSID